MNDLFQTAPIDAVTWLKILAAAAVTWAIVELEKAIRRHAARNRSRPEASNQPLRGAA